MANREILENQLRGRPQRSASGVFMARSSGVNGWRVARSPHRVVRFAVLNCVLAVALGGWTAIGFAQEPDLRPKEWKEAFDAVYRLEEGEVLRRIGPPFIPERMDYYVDSNPGQAEAIPRGPDRMVFHWNKELRGWGMSFGSGTSQLSGVMRHGLRFASYEFEGPDELLEVDVPGDWIVRNPATKKELLKALSRILHEELNLEIRFVKRRVEREVIVARGRYEFRPLPGEVDRRARRVHIYAENLDPTSGAGGGSGDLKEFLRWVGSRMNRWLVDETEHSEGRVEWNNHRSSSALSIGGDSAKTAMVLRNLARQTSLDFTMERRLVDVWSVERVN